MLLCSTLFIKVVEHHTVYRSDFKNFKFSIKSKSENGEEEA